MNQRADLFKAVECGNLGLVRDLLASDPALAKVKDEQGATALHYAALNGHREIVRLLQENGADINVRDDRFDATPTGWAIEYLRDIGGLLAIEVEDMLFAIRERDVRWVRRLLARSPALAKATDTQGKPLSEHARGSGLEEIARLFEDRSAGEPNPDPEAGERL